MQPSDAEELAELGQWKRNGQPPNPGNEIFAIAEVGKMIPSIGCQGIEDSGLWVWLQALDEEGPDSGTTSTRRLGSDDDPR